MKRVLSIILSAAMIAGMLCGFKADSKQLRHPTLLADLGPMAEDPEYTPNVPEYSVKKNLSNIINLDQFYLTDNEKDALYENNFFVSSGGGMEFFEEYEYNRYAMIPNFVTVDAMMHTYHMYYAMLQKRTEKEHLADIISSLSDDLYDTCEGMYSDLEGSDWEDAAATATAFFAVGDMLMGNNPKVDKSIKKLVDEEVKLISAQDAIADSPLFGEMEDYSQYKPRGYYDGDEQLEKYFRTMMWYGRRNFSLKDEELTKAAIIVNLAMNEVGMEDWYEVYCVTAFFAGASDDCGYIEYMPLIEKAYGKNPEAEDLTYNDKAFDSFMKQAKKLPSPKINSIPMWDDEGKTVKTDEAKGFRFMGQRFTLDEAIFTRLTYSNVKGNEDDEKRYLPDALDVAAAFGSDVALDILEECGETEYEKYMDNMEELREELNEADESLLNASLYSAWVNTITPLLREKEEGYPQFMMNENWARKNVESFLGSWTELKHDSVLYSKQMMAEMGGGWDEEIDDRGYVEPEPEVFSRLADLTEKTSEGLDSFGFLSRADKKNLNKLSELASSLSEISVKELTGDEVTDDEYELIRDFGGSLEHFWEEAIKGQYGLGDNDYVYSQEYPAALIVDVATDPNDGYILEEATGRVDTVVVVVPIDGTLRLARGSVFSYYQFIQPISEERLTDSEWRRMLGVELNDDMEYEYDNDIEKPYWTLDYREDREY